MRHDYQMRNPTALGAGLGIGLGVAGTLAGAALARGLIDRALRRKEAPGPGGRPPPWLAEVSAALDPGTTLGKLQLPFAFPVALNTLGSRPVDGPTQEQFPYITQPERPLLMRGRQGTLIPLEYFFTRGDGEVGLKVDTDALLQRGVAYDVTGEATYADGTPAGAVAQVDALLVNLSPALASSSFEGATARVKNDGDDFSVPGHTRDAFVKTVLQGAVPGLDWSQGPALVSEKWSSSTSMLWHGVGLVAQLAYQRAWIEG